MQYQKFVALFLVVLAVEVTFGKRIETSLYSHLLSRYITPHRVRRQELPGGGVQPLYTNYRPIDYGSGHGPGIAAVYDAEHRTGTGVRPMFYDNGTFSGYTGAEEKHANKTVYTVFRGSQPIGQSHVLNPVPYQQQDLYPAQHGVPYGSGYPPQQSVSQLPYLPTGGNSIPPPQHQIPSYGPPQLPAPAYQQPQVPQSIPYAHPFPYQPPAPSYPLPYQGLPNYHGVPAPYQPNPYATYPSSYVPQVYASYGGDSDDHDIGDIDNSITYEGAIPRSQYNRLLPSYKYGNESQPALYGYGLNSPSNSGIPYMCYGPYGLTPCSYGVPPAAYPKKKKYKRTTTMASTSSSTTTSATSTSTTGTASTPSTSTTSGSSTSGSSTTSTGTTTATTPTTTSSDTSTSSTASTTSSTATTATSATTTAVPS